MCTKAKALDFLLDASWSYFTVSALSLKALHLESFKRAGKTNVLFEAERFKRALGSAGWWHIGDDGKQGTASVSMEKGDRRREAREGEMRNERED